MTLLNKANYPKKYFRQKKKNKKIKIIVESIDRSLT